MRGRGGRELVGATPRQKSGQPVFFSRSGRFLREHVVNTVSFQVGGRPLSEAGERRGDVCGAQDCAL